GRAAAGAGDLRRDDAQLVATVERAKDVIAGTVEDAWVARREDERRVPVEAELHPFLGPRPDRTPFSRVQVAPAHDPVLTLHVHEVGVSRIDPADKAVAAAHDDPVLVDRADAAERLARAAPTAV